MSETEKKYPVIVISRQYSAGGRSVAKGLSEKLGIPWYDKDLMRKTAEESGISEENIKAAGERVNRTMHFMGSLFAPVTYESETDVIQRAQEEVILKLAKEGPCIIIGRCANVILKRAGIPNLSVFLYADIEHRMKRAAELGENNSGDLKKYIAKRDNMRAGYYKTYTGHDQGAFEDYNICLDTGAVGYDKAVDMLAVMAEGMKY